MTSRHKVLSEITTAVLDVSAQLWSRIECCFWDYPWKLVRLVNPSYTGAETAAICRDFFNTSICDLDKDLSMPLRFALGGPADTQQAAIIGLLERLSKCANATNMGLAHQLAEVMSSTRHSRHKPTVERVVHSGQLSQLMHQHLSVGKAD